MICVKDKSKCCGCEACLNSCPKHAISLQMDKKGFLFPIVDSSLCIDCGICDRVCAFVRENQNQRFHSDVYAAVNLDNGLIRESASGGAFSALAKWMLEKGGIVYGSAWDQNMMPHHIRIDKKEDIVLLQGSKYVQDKMGTIYGEVKEDLKNGKYVLFCGTPCQCDALRSYLIKPYGGLYTVELVCHGVPNADFLRSYLDLIEEQIDGRIINLKFRDKKRGWGALLNITYQTKNGIIKHKYLTSGESYYYYYYWGGNLYRKSCYSCKYASLDRKSDFTIGDYWGVQRAHPEISTSNGVSLFLTNTDKGKSVIGDLKDYLSLTPSTIEDAMRENGQLLHTSEHHEELDFLWDIYVEDGAKGLDKFYRKNHRRDILKGKIKRLMPMQVKKILKKFI